jgi:hypothetical protein
MLGIGTPYTGYKDHPDVARMIQAASLGSELCAFFLSCAREWPHDSFNSVQEGGQLYFRGAPGLLEEMCILRVKLNDHAIPQESVTREIRGMLRGIYVDLIVSRQKICDSGSANRNQDG